ncbi:hypothetical protein L596_022488 [Steinernema carpocapsae]|uniref:Uncharacterized protein n=1 Tax=Steinernema carpocapsae TaxID=34508 RepID=A0A4U5MLV1_STECR|nr:hypothetical protein L596_022488 [Steinernema carpocapsae]
MPTETLDGIKVIIYIGFDQRCFGSGFGLGYPKVPGLGSDPDRVTRKLQVRVTDRVTPRFFWVYISVWLFLDLICL